MKEERLGSYVYVGGRGRWDERREVLQMIFFFWGGGFKIFWKSGGICTARGDLSYAFTSGVWGHAPPKNFFKMVQPYLKISQPH